MNNEKGSTLIENIVSIFLLSVFSLMVFSALIACTNILSRAVEQNDKLYGVYTEIESDMYETMSSAGRTTVTIEGNTYNIEENTSISFTINGTAYTIEGSTIYDDEEKMGEFYRND